MKVCPETRNLKILLTSTKPAQTHPKDPKTTLKNKEIACRIKSFLT